MWGSRGLEWTEFPSYQLNLFIIQGFPGDSVVKNLLDHIGDMDSIPGWGRPPEREMATHSSILACTIPLDKRAFEGCSPWGRKESDDDLATKQNNNNIYNPSICLPEWQVLQRKWMRWILFLTSQSQEITFNLTLFLNKGSGSCSSSSKATFNEGF